MPSHARPVGVSSWTDGAWNGNAQIPCVAVLCVRRFHGEVEGSAIVGKPDMTAGTGKRQAVRQIAAADGRGSR